MYNNSYYHDQEAVKTSKYTDGIARIKKPLSRVIVSICRSLAVETDFFQAIFSTCTC